MYGKQQQQQQKLKEKLSQFLFELVLGLHIV
jgi:hypothetical protein